LQELAAAPASCEKHILLLLGYNSTHETVYCGSSDLRAQEIVPTFVLQSSCSSKHQLSLYAMRYFPGPCTNTT